MEITAQRRRTACVEGTGRAFREEAESPHTDVSVTSGWRVSRREDASDPAGKHHGLIGGRRVVMEAEPVDRTETVKKRASEEVGIRFESMFRVGHVRIVLSSIT